VTRGDVRVGLVRPDLLGTYGDGGNAIVLRERLVRRGIPARIEEIQAGRIPGDLDLLVLGGAEDAPLRTLAADERLAGSVRDAVAAGVPVVAICGGFQVLGESFVDGAGEEQRGFGVLACRTSGRLSVRAVGEIVVDCAMPSVGVLTGFENHAGITVRDAECAPLGTVVHGVGNGNGDGSDGALVGRVVGTYMHGPVLARNPALADLVLGWVCGPLEPLAIPEVDRLRAERLRRARDRRPDRLGRFRRRTATGSRTPP
jgi:lipid II isoglutaminyl synthase (glutamine-hydrolysing)